MDGAIFDRRMVSSAPLAANFSPCCVCVCVQFPRSRTEVRAVHRHVVVEPSSLRSWRRRSARSHWIASAAHFDVLMVDTPFWCRRLRPIGLFSSHRCGEVLVLNRGVTCRSGRCGYDSPSCAWSRQRAGRRSWHLANTGVCTHMKHGGQEGPACAPLAGKGRRWICSAWLALAAAHENCIADIMVYTCTQTTLLRHVTMVVSRSHGVNVWRACAA